MQASPSIVHLDHVRFNASQPAAPLSVQLGPGEGWVIDVAPRLSTPPVADLISGLVEPQEGTVCFCDQAWPTLDAVAADRQRARIGRVFEHTAWISNLDLDENITLAQRYHHGIAVDALRKQAEEHAAFFGMSGLPTQRPSQLTEAELMRCQWVRAWLADPVLLLLEFPEQHVAAESLQRLRAAIDARLEAGSALVLQSRDADWLLQGRSAPMRQHRITEEGWMEVA
jgi:phospholipid/cholesterol/gamma-HCH transport system ATP-binding protein